MWNLWDTLQSSTSLPLFLLQFCAPLLSLSLSLFLSFSFSIEASSLSFLSKSLSWWWSSSFHGLFPSGRCLILPLLLYLLLQLHGWKSPLKDLIEALRSILHRSFSTKFPSGSAFRMVVVLVATLSFCHWWGGRRQWPSRVWQNPIRVGLWKGDLEICNGAWRLFEKWKDGNLRRWLKLGYLGSLTQCLWNFFRVGDLCITVLSTKWRVRRWRFFFPNQCWRY